MRKPTRLQLNAKRIEVLGFADKHSLVINPAKGMEQYVKNIFEFGCCPCDKTRDCCPCSQALQEIEKMGHCLCRLFWRDLDTFKATYEIEKGVENEGGDIQKDSKGG